MRPFSASPLAAAKVALAVVSLAAVAAVVGSQLAPDVPVGTVLLWSALGAIALFSVVTTAAVALLSFQQFILRKGGTDAQWFWFSGEPRGLAQQRDHRAHLRSKG